MRIFSGGLAATIVQTLLAFLIAGHAIAQCEDPDRLTISIIPTEEPIQEFTIYKPQPNNNFSQVEVICDKVKFVLNENLKSH